VPTYCEACGAARIGLARRRGGKKIRPRSDAREIIAWREDANWRQRWRRQQFGR